MKLNGILSYKNKLDLLFPKIGKVSDKVLNSKKVILCFMNRSGSNYYANLLSNTNLSGYPEEVFNLDEIERQIKDHHIESLTAYIDFLYERHTSGNNVFGFQVGIYQLYYLLSKNNELGLFDDKSYFLYIIRSDKIMQAVSFYKADLTQQWASFSKTCDNNNIELKYDRDALVLKYNVILSNIAHFEEVFAQYNISPFRINYEMLLDRPRKYILDTLHFMDECKITFNEIKLNTKFKKQRNSLSEEWGLLLQKELKKMWNEKYY